MTSLPITSNNTQPPAKGTPPLRNDSSASGHAAPTSQANSATNDQTENPFSVLLARQIGEAGLPATTKIPVAIDNHAAAGDVDPMAKVMPDPATISNDPANSLTAMLLQIPVQQEDASLRATPGVSALRGDPSENKGRLNIAPPINGTKGVKQRIEENLRRTSGKSTGTDYALLTTDISQADPSSLIPLSSDAVKHVELAISATGQTQTSPNMAKTVAYAAPSATGSAVMPNILTSNIPADIPQTITTPLGSSGWADEFSQKIIWMNTQQNQIAELHLNPPDLGPLNVVLKISDNQLTAQFTSPHGAVRDAVENALPKLRELLADNNIMLGNATVSDQPPRDRSGDGFMNQDSGTTARRETSYKASEQNELLPTITQNLPARRHNGMLDTFA